ncbi:MAG: DNA-binding protein [Candidatus Methanomethylophilaceae archaeon]|nr:DNA-binding protein [Candidatus Methanomethylophilaceae archaeon]MDY5871679.1 DNA-binding protein [Candidatus Methanomethylophilaceae archaeon]
MEDPELEAIRQRRMAEMQNSQQQAMAQQQAAEQRRQQMEIQKQMVLRQILSPEARDRLSNLRIANAEMCNMVEMQLINLAQSGRLQGIVTDDMLRNILRQIAPQHREITIERR